MPWWPYGTGDEVLTEKKEFADEESSPSRREVGEVICGRPARFTQKTPRDWRREARSSAAGFSGAPL